MSAVVEYVTACNDLCVSARIAIDSLKKLAEAVNAHREGWLCDGQGQWPDRFTLLNRYVRTDVEPPFIIND